MRELVIEEILELEWDVMLTKLVRTSTTFPTVDVVNEALEPRKEELAAMTDVDLLTLFKDLLVEKTKGETIETLRS